MKTIYQIIIIILVALSLFLAKEDVVVVYNKINNNLNDYFNHFIIKNKDNLNIANSEPKEDIKKEIINLPSKIEVPGALLISDNLNFGNSLNSVFNNSNAKFSSSNIIKITNRYRYENGNISPLKENEKLNFSANKKVEDIFNKQYFEHISPDGVGVSDLATEVSYEYITVGENLALGNFSNDEALVSAWMASPGHRANILNNHYTEIGVAIKEGIYEGKKVWVSVQHFGLPKSFCPSIDEVMYGVIQIEEKQVKKIEDDLAIRKEMIEKRVVYEGLTTNEQINKYNGMIVVYNQLISELKNKIDTYNKQIKEFNDCLMENTTTPAH